MRRLLPALLLPAAALAATAAASAPLTVSKTSAVVSDPLNDAMPLRIPGAAVDYTVTVTNPSSNSLTTVTGVVYSDPIPPKTAMRVLDLAGTGKGPVEFTDGSLLGLGLLGSNLTYTYASLSSTTDRLDFSSDGGTTWTYVPVPDSNGYDANVTNVRVRLSGNQTAGRLRTSVQGDGEVIRAEGRAECPIFGFRIDLSCDFGRIFAGFAALPDGVFRMLAFMGRRTSKEIACRAD